MPQCLKRIDEVIEYRLHSTSVGTRALAKTPLSFHVENIPKSDFLLIPAISSERRFYIPIGFMHKDVLCSNRVFIITNATLYHFGVLSSIVHNAWNRAFGGRMKSDYNYSKEVVYNNFPWPQANAEQKTVIELLAKAVLNARDNHKDEPLAHMYDPRIMPDDLRKAHERLDKAVIKAYNKEWNTESEIVADLMIMYQKLVKKEA